MPVIISSAIIEYENSCFNSDLLVVCCLTHSHLLKIYLFVIEVISSRHPMHTHAFIRVYIYHSTTPTIRPVRPRVYLERRSIVRHCLRRRETNNAEMYTRFSE